MYLESEREYLKSTASWRMGRLGSEVGDCCG